MQPNEAAATEPEDPDARYDLAGNLLPPLPKENVPVPDVRYAPAPGTGASGFGAPAYTPPPGSSAAYIPAAPVRSAQGPVLYVGLVAGFLLLLGLIFGIHALKPKPVLAPTAFKTYTALDSSFSCDQPTLWTLHETGAIGGSISTVTFEDGKARVKVISDATGSLMADTMTSSNANLPPEQQIPPVEKLHVMDKKQLSDSIPDYKEGEIQKIQSDTGDARLSEWTAGDSVHGYRVTMLGREREFTVICFCPERNWKLLSPAFWRIISSVKPGSPS